MVLSYLRFCGDTLSRPYQDFFLKTVLSFRNRARFGILIIYLLLFF